MSPIRSLLCLTKLFFTLTCTEKPLFFLLITSFSQYTTICFVSFVYSVFNEHLNISLSRNLPFVLQRKIGTTFKSLTLASLEKSNQKFLVGPSGLEPPTSCLSGTRSNLLSYEPMWLVCGCSHSGLPFWKFLWLPFFSKKVTGGDDGIRTHDPLLAGQVLSQLSYTPI